MKMFPILFDRILIFNLSLYSFFFKFKLPLYKTKPHATKFKGLMNQCFNIFEDLLFIFWMLTAHKITFFKFDVLKDFREHA